MASLFERCGGFATVSKVVMSFYDRVLDSDVAGPYFESVDLKTVIDHQTKFVAQTMGGPIVYSDEQLKRVHAKHSIESEAFDEVGRLMQETLEDFDFAPSDIDLVMEAIGARRSCIVAN